MRLRTLCVIGALGLSATCSIDDRNVSVHSGRTTREAGNEAGFAGEAGGGGSAGAPSPPELCTGTRLTTGLVTDFSDAESIIDDEQNPGIDFTVFGGTALGQSFVYSSLGLELPAVSLETASDGNKALRFVATPEIPVEVQVVGFGFGWLMCFDATGYEGVSFDIRGTQGSCLFQVGVQFSQNTIVRLNDAASCVQETRCYAPQSEPLDLAAGKVEVPFASMSGGMPMDTVDLTTIVGLNFQLVVPYEGPLCEVDLTVDNVEFYR